MISVIEISDKSVLGVKLFSSDREEAAFEHAVELAKENTSYSDEEIRGHLTDSYSHEEGDWQVVICYNTRFDPVSWERRLS